MTYAYIDGQLKYEKIGNATFDKFQEYSIHKTDSEYIFQFVKNQISVAHVGCESKGDYILYPYFGGDETAPHDIHIDIYVVPAE